MKASELKEILEQHKLWIDTNRVQGNGADLEDADLDGESLENAYLSGANLSGANLTQADLGGANLYGANLYGAILTRADLTGADLYGADLTGADLYGADLYGANLTGASLRGTDLQDANLKGAILPDISWIIPGCLAQLNHIKYGFWLEKERKRDNFVQDSLGFIIQNNSEEETFDMLVEDRIIRNIPDWVKLSGLKQIESV